jgi:hypothetical protein
MMNNDRVYYSRDAETRAKREMAASRCWPHLLRVTSARCGPRPLFGKKARHDLAQSLGENWENGRKAIDPMAKRLEGKFGELLTTVEEGITRLT